MIRKLQIKFVAMCMILVTAVLGVVFTAVFFSAKQNIEVISHQVLQRVMEDDTPSGRPDLGLNRGGEDVLLPYFTVNLWDRSGIYEASPRHRATLRFYNSKGRPLKSRRLL